MVAQLLSGVLAGVVGLGSVALYLAAFFFPEVHRRHDFFWSGVGCFYALILWLDAGQITPTELLGHLASISLMGWLGWQTLTLRRKRTPISLQTPYTADSWPTFRREMTALALDALRQTPLRRWLPNPNQGEPPTTKGIRVSALKEVGYEFVDSIEPPEPTLVMKSRPLFPAVKGNLVQDNPVQDNRVNRGSIQGDPVPGSPTPTPPTPESPAPMAQDQQVPSPAAVPKVAQRQQPRNQASPTMVSPAASRPGGKSPSPAQRNPMSLGQRAQGLATWIQDLIRAKTAPKPKKAVIEIPPRPSSLAKRSDPSRDPDAQPSIAASPSAPAAPEIDRSQAAAPDKPSPAPSPPQADYPAPETSNWEEEEDWI